MSQVSMSVDIIPIINEALERRMYHFTMWDTQGCAWGIPCTAIQSYGM